MADGLSVKIDDLISGSDSLAAAADSVATIAGGSDVLASNFDHVEEVFDNLQDFLSELKTNSWYAPVGLVSPFAGSTAPTGWLLCDGSVVSQTTYADLYAVISGTYNTGGEGAGNFRLPDLRGRVVSGVDNMGGNDAGRLSWQNDLGTVGPSSKSTDGGAQTHTLSVAELPSHMHTFSGTTNTVLEKYGSSNTADTATDHAHSTTFKYETVQFGGTANTLSFLVRSDFATPDGTTVYTSGGFSANHQHNYNHAHDYSGTTLGSGSGSAHNNMQPTMLLNYIIKN